MSSPMKVEKEVIKKETITIQLKKAIIEKYEHGAGVRELCQLYNESSSTICAILKKKEEIKRLDLVVGVTRINKQRHCALEDVEKLLLVWMNEKKIGGEIVTENSIRHKAKALFDDLVIEMGSSVEEVDSFKASPGWFVNFKKRSGINYNMSHEEVASVDEMSKAPSLTPPAISTQSHQSEEVGTMNIPYFIECVKKHPCLWNVNNTNFTDLELKKRAWQDIMEATGEDYMTCTTKWRSLRYTYSRRLRSLIKGEIKTETMWHHFEQLDFLKNFVPMKNFKKTGDHINVIMVDEPFKEGNSSDEDIKIHVPSQSYIPCSSNNPITSTVDYTYHDNKLPSDNESSEKLSGKRKRDSNLEETYENDNEDELFGRIVICKLRKFSERQKSKIRISLLQTFLNIDVENNCE